MRKLILKMSFTVDGLSETRMANQTGYQKKALIHHWHGGRKTLNFADPAARTYDDVRCLAAGEKHSRERHWLRNIHNIVDHEISISPFQGGRKLFMAYWLAFH